MANQQILRQRVMEVVTSCCGLPRELWTEDDECRVDEFALDSSLPVLVVYQDSSGVLHVGHNAPTTMPELACYFVRVLGAVITAETFPETVELFTVRGNPVNNLLREVRGLHSPRLDALDMDKTIRDDYTKEMHCFLLNLTDDVYEKTEETVLYIPAEVLQYSLDEASKDTELLHRMEVVAIHWTDQLKQLLSERPGISDEFGPLQEIDFWKSHSEKLVKLSRQLQRPEVKHIQDVLQLAGSVYGKRFSKQVEDVQTCSLQAESNLKFLSLLKEPLEELMMLTPSQLAPKLGHIVSLVRVIWINSEHYNTKEQITGLFCKLGNQISRLCLQSVSLDRVFEGWVSSSRKTLTDCISCCLDWKEIYQQAADLHQTCSPHGWILDSTCIFVVIDDSIKRFRELLEVCNCQSQFGRWEDGHQRPLPCFSSPQAPEFSRMLVEVEGHFQRGLQDLKTVHHEDILNVKSSVWFTEYSKFCAVVTNVEMMMESLIHSVFKTVNLVQEGVRLLDVFRPMSTREAIRSTTEQKAEEVYSLFHRELRMIHKEMNQNSWPRPDHMPAAAGKTSWLRALRRRIHTPMEVIVSSSFLPQTSKLKDLQLSYSQMVRALEEMERRNYREWTESLDPASFRTLSQPLMVRCRHNAASLELNFDDSLLTLFSEIQHWSGLKLEIPQSVCEVYQHRDDIRRLRETTLLLIRQHNSILVQLSPDELSLFGDQMVALEKKLQPGLSKVLWSSPGAANFIQDGLQHVNKVKLMVDEFKVSIAPVSSLCHQLSETLLVKLDGKTVYRNLEFEEDQKTHLEICGQTLHAVHQRIVDIMLRIRNTFSNDGLEDHWVTYTEKVDYMVEKALRKNFKTSLEELSRSINGDGKTSHSPLFRVLVALSQTTMSQTTPQVEFTPTLDQLAHTVNVWPRLITAVAQIKRLPECVCSRWSLGNAIHTNIENDEDIRRIQDAITTGIMGNAVHLEDSLKTWNKYKDLWENNQESIVERYQNQNPSVSTFDADIHRYTEKAFSIQEEETMLDVGCIRLDFSELKSSSAQLCTDWQNKFTELLSNMAAGRLQELHDALHDYAHRLSLPPLNLDHHSESMKLLETVQGDLAKTQSQIPLIQEQFAILEKYNIHVEPAVQTLCQGLDEDWIWFQQVITDSEIMLQTHKDKFRNNLMVSSEELNKNISIRVHEFTSTGPFSSSLNADVALHQLAEHRSRLETLKQQHRDLSLGLKYCRVETETSRDMMQLDQDISSLQQVWEISEQWSSSWNIWKSLHFTALNTESLETTTRHMLDKLNTLQQHIQDKDWDIVDFSRNKMKQLQRIIPLISELRNPAMRDRHWQLISDLLQTSLDQNSSDFTLDRIVSLSLDEFSDRIREICRGASRELSIEKGLEDVSKTWDETFLDIAAQQGHYWLSGSEVVFQALEDNMLVLSTMKTCPSVRAFEQEVDVWEQRLSHSLKVLELILSLQHRWTYLQKVFQNKDVREKLPADCKQFEDISLSWKTIMNRLHNDNNVLQGTHYPGLLESLSDLRSGLEGTRKALDLYLETKRKTFPRFYFLSDDSVLEILESENPKAVMPHLRKCFSNIHSLRFKKDGHRSATGIFSADGEFLSLRDTVDLDRPVELWLCDVDTNTRLTLKNSLSVCLSALRKTEQTDRWVKQWPGQLVMTARQIQWTSDVHKSLSVSEQTTAASPLESTKNKQLSLIQCYSKMLRGKLSKSLRVKVSALVMVEVHALDVIDDLIRTGCSNARDFEWQSQLRVYWKDDCIIRQTNACFTYGYEYLGNCGRIVITPLTHRCFLTLTTALHLHQFGSPSGPAATGKTETVKDLGKALGMNVLVVNCCEGLDFRAVGRVLSGLAQTGAWCCFMDLNRIHVEVLSVLAQQLRALQSALVSRHTQFDFEGQNIRLVSSCGVFITINPSSSCRSELPHSLGSLLRPVSMAVPDSAVIAEVLLISLGFTDCKVLARRVSALFSLAVQLMSKQLHYDFGLRTLISTLHYAGKQRRAFPDLPDEQILLMAVNDMNVCKLTRADVSVFTGITQDVFPAVETPTKDEEKLKAAIEVQLRSRGLQPTPFTVNKVVQLQQTRISRHSTMLLGQTGSGKSVIWTTLQAVISSMPGLSPVQVHPLNPKAMTLGELYGERDISTNQWRDGALSAVLRSACSEENSETWIVLDGPIDSLWAENINSVMDDNKVLTLINGERILIPKQVSLLFEVDDLSRASPATVSRCGVVHCDLRDLGWRPWLQSWMEQRPKAEVCHLKALIEKYVESTLNFKRSSCTEPTPITELNGVTTLCRLYDSLTRSNTWLDVSDSDTLGRLVELWFVFSLIWSIGVSVDEDGRRRMDGFIRDKEGSFPTKDTVYDYYVDTKNRTWASFEDKLPRGWRYEDNSPLSSALVPTVDSVRYSLVVQTLVLDQHPVLLTGPEGSGKTSLALRVLQGLDQSWSGLTVNITLQTSSRDVQASVESCVERKTKDVLMPAGRKRLLCFLDDLNLTTPDLCGSRPPLELLRFWIDYGFWYDRHNQSRKSVQNVSLLAAMASPGGSRTQISGRVQSRFSLINVTSPHESQLRRIYGSIINQKLESFNEDLKSIGDVVTHATIELYSAVSAKFRPTPAKTHYLFNLRDISKVFQGLLRADPEYHYTKHTLTRLWIHECFRVMSDRLVDQTDTESFVSLMEDVLGSHFDLSYHNICPDKQPPVFGEFLNESGVYEDLLDMDSVRSFMETQMENYNRTPGVVPLSLVLFRDAVQHITRVVRVMKRPRGHALLLGAGASGRRSLAKMAAFICQQEVFQLEVTRKYDRQQFRADVKKLLWRCAVENKPSVFLFTDTQIVDESFLEEVSHILNSGHVPNLFTNHELLQVCSSLTESTDGVVLNPDFMLTLRERVDRNLHMVLCMSPAGPAFRKRILQYPALVNCTTMNWVSDWPKVALLEVAERSLSGLDLGSSDGIQSRVSSVLVNTHQAAARFSLSMTPELRGHHPVTPTSYLELLSGYTTLLSEKRSDLDQQLDRIRTGLLKVRVMCEEVEVMTLELEEVKKQTADIQRQCVDFLSVTLQHRMRASSHSQVVSTNTSIMESEELKCRVMSEEVQRDLEESQPALDEANKALRSLSEADMMEMKNHVRPPPLVETVMEAVMILLLGRETTWTEAQDQLGDSNFIPSLLNFNVDSVTESVLEKVGRYCRLVDFQPNIVGKVSAPAKTLCMWVRATEAYGWTYRLVELKRCKLNAAMKQLEERQTALAEDQNRLLELQEQQQQLQQQLGDRLKLKESLRRRREEMEEKLQRANDLRRELDGQRACWEDRAASLESDLMNLVGDCVLAAAFMSYSGPLLSTSRDTQLGVWRKELQAAAVSCSPGFSFSGFLSRPSVVREWKEQGLTSDLYSTENALIITKGTRWPLLVDPQGLTVKWIKNMELKRGLTVINSRSSSLLALMETSVQLGRPVLLHNVQDSLDPQLGPVLTRSLVQRGGRLLVKLGHKEVEFNPEFRLYLSTRRWDPQDLPEISAHTNLVNCAVTEQGVEGLLLRLLVSKVRVDLEDQKDRVLKRITSDQRELQELEDTILRLLNESSGSLLDDVQLVNSLQSCRVTAATLSERLRTSEQKEVNVHAAREDYRPCAQRASVLFSVLNQLVHIDPTYRFSLDAYTQLFSRSISSSRRSLNLKERISNLNEYHTYAVYRFGCRSLFHRHKLLFSFQLCVRILELAGKMDRDEYEFLLRGRLRPEEKDPMENPCSSWLDESRWANITELNKLSNFQGIRDSVVQDQRGWRLWVCSAEPEKATLPGNWDMLCNDFQKLLIVRSLRQDRVASCITSFIVKNLGHRFVEPPLLDMKAAVEESSSRTPLIFVLSSGAEPTAELQQLAEACGRSHDLQVLHLGRDQDRDQDQDQDQGRAHVARTLIQDGIKKGHWVFLADCHFSLHSWPELDRLVDELQEQEPNSDFRLWLSSSSHPGFPVGILQAGIKITFEPPKGVKANMLSLFQLVTKSQFSSRRSCYRTAVFCLCFLHSILLERKRFLQLGWNSDCGFTHSDFQVSEQLLRVYLDRYEEIPWDVIKFLIGEVVYGGRVTDQWDRRLLTTYINDYFCAAAVDQPGFKLSSLSSYYVPPDGPQSSYQDYISSLPSTEHPEVFGLQPDALKAVQQAESRELLDTLLCLQPSISISISTTAASGPSREEKVLELLTDIRRKIPAAICSESSSLLQDQQSPVNCVLLQEIQTYNNLLKTISVSLDELEDGISGSVSMSSSAEETINHIYDARVPPMWRKAYPSLKPLAAWIMDLVQRVSEFREWMESSRPPPSIWISSFTSPGRFLTAVMQTSARQRNVPVDSLSWKFRVLTADDSDSLYPPKEGVFVRGLYLKGARWDSESCCLVEAESQTVSPMPSVHFRPVRNKSKKLDSSVYLCPCYYDSVRSSFVVAVELESGAVSPEHWVRRGTALLMSLDQ